MDLRPYPALSRRRYEPREHQSCDCGRADRDSRDTTLACYGRLAPESVEALSVRHIQLAQNERIHDAEHHGVCADW
jgi:hypothetical protein